MTPEQAKGAALVVTGMWQSEVAATSQVLAAVKDATRDYKPDAKSRSAWEIARHIASADTWFIDSIVSGQFQWDPEAAKKSEEKFTSAQSVADYYASTIPARLKALGELPGEQLLEVIDFMGMMKMPRVNFISFANNHSMHHRGQLAAYLRALGSKVPNIYGPSADAEPARA
jgi:uncharacterized damage-inducible protein DinB